MHKTSPSRLPHLTSPTLLTAAYHEAVLTLTQVLKFGTRRSILTAFRAVLVARLALLRDTGTAHDLIAADAVAHEISHIDRDLATRHPHTSN
jgi:hypothetical protein